jgi:hypothetical protein
MIREGLGLRNGTAGTPAKKFIWRSISELGTDLRPDEYFATTVAKAHAMVL